MVRSQGNTSWLEGQTDVGDQLSPFFGWATEHHNFSEGTEQSNEFIIGADESSSG